MVAFRSQGAVNTGGFINAAAAVGADAASFADTTFKNSPDYDTISTLTARGQGITDRAGVKFAGTLLSDQQQARMDALTVPKILQRNQQKMAGELAARSQGWLGLINKKDPVKPFQYDLSDYDNILKSQKQQIEEEAQRIANLKYVPLEVPKTSTNESTSDLNSNSETNNTSTPLSGSQKESAKKMYDYMKSLGVSDTHAKGMLANIKGESDFNVGIMGDGGESGGLFQMNTDRYDKMVANVPNWKTDWKGQIRHAIQDDRAPEYLSIDFKSPVAAADWFLHNYERPHSDNHADREALNRSFIGSLNF